MSEPLSNQFRPPDELEFLTVLGLVPPVTVDDVKQAYLEKAKTAHPDHGGDIDGFKRLQEAFEQATEYAQFKAGRMQWLSRWVEQYAEQDQIIQDIKTVGGTVQVNSSDSLSRSIGPDFAVVLDKVVAIRLSGPKIDDAIMAKLGAGRRLLAGLRKLELIDTAVTSTGLVEIKQLESLRELDLTGTQVDLKTLEDVLTGLPLLEAIGLDNTGIGWASRLKLRVTHRKLTIS